MDNQELLSLLNENTKTKEEYHTLINQVMESI